MAPPPSHPTLETARLILRPREAEEAAVYRRLWLERDPRVPAHRRVSADGRPTAADIAESIRREEAQPGLGLLAVVHKDDGDVIGYCGLVGQAGGTANEPQLAYELFRAAHGRGYATEAAGAVVDWADRSGIGPLWADVWNWNVASRRVLAKLGFVEAGAPQRESGDPRSLLLVRPPGAAAASLA
jgi:ribosomal-protein-alanine N-acetyltransferase